MGSGGWKITPGLEKPQKHQSKWVARCKEKREKEKQKKPPFHVWSLPGFSEDVGILADILMQLDLALSHPNNNTNPRRDNILCEIKDIQIRLNAFARELWASAGIENPYQTPEGLKEVNEE